MESLVQYAPGAKRKLFVLLTSSYREYADSIVARIIKGGKEQIEPRAPQTVLSYVQKRHSNVAQVQAVPAIAARLRHTALGDSIKVSPAF